MRLTSIYSFLIARIKTPDKKSFGGSRVYLGLRFQGITLITAGKGMAASMQGSCSLCSCSLEVEHRQKARLGYTTSKPTPNDPLPPVMLELLKVPGSQNSITSWGPNVPTHGLAGDISQTNYNIKETAHALWMAVEEGKHFYFHDSAMLFEE